MYDAVLIPVDLSATNDLVLTKATRLAQAGETEVTLLHVIEMLDDITLDDDPEFYEELRENAEKKITEWAEKLTEAGFDVTAEVKYGESGQGQEIVATAREIPADLIVMRSHVVDPDESREQVGTVSHQVALFAPCSVLLVRS